MYPVSEAYKNAIAQNERNVKIAGTITLKNGTVINISDEDIVQGSLYVSEQCVSGEDIEIGNVYASELGLSLNSPPENPYALDGARIVLNFGIETSDDVWEYVPLGYFYVTEIERKTNAVALKALDGMILFDTDLSGVLTTGTPYEMISSCCTKVGITLATDSATFSTFANGNMTFTFPADSKVQTCRDLIMWLCQLTGTFARMNRLGQLEIVPAKLGASVKTIDKQQRFTSDVSDSYVKITKVAMKVGDVEYSQGTDGMTMVLEENPLLVGKSETEINTVLNNILNQVTTAEYIPYSVNFAGDPALQAGDYINLTGIKVFDKIRATFSRSSVAYKSDGTQVPANTPRFEQGRFGKAVMVEEGTTNLITNNPSFEGDFTGWNRFTSYGGATYTVTSEKAKIGQYSAKVVTDGTATGDPGVETVQYTISANSTYTFSAALAGTFGANQVWLAIRWFDANNTIVLDNSYTIPTALTNDFKTYSCTFTAPSNAVKASCHVRISRTAIGTLYIDTAQLEAKSYASSFIIGTRAAESLTIPTAGVLNPQEGTVECWVKLSHLNPNNYNAFFTSGDVNAPGPRILIMREFEGGNVNKIRVWDGDGSSEAALTSVTTLQAGIWYYVAFTWSPSGRKLYVNGVLEASNTRSNNLGFATLAKIGSWQSRGYLNGLIDDLRISNKARTDAEIAAAYQSGQPLPVDEWTTLKMNFDGSLSTITTAGDSIVTHSTWRYRGPHNIKAVGKSALVRGVQAQQTKSVSAVKTVAETAREIAQAANQSTQLIQDAITGYVLIRKNENTGSNEILIMDNPDPAQARKVWRWNMGGLGYSDNVVGVDNPDRQYTIAITMDGAINADFIKTGILHSNIIGARSITADKLQIGMTKTSSLYVRGTGLNRSANRIVRLDGVDIVNGRGRGLTLTILNRSDHSHVSSTNYDVYGDDTARNNLAKALNALGNDKIVILTSFDAIRFNSALEAAIERCGGGNVKDSYLVSNYRLPYVLIGIPGIGKGRGIEVFTSTAADAPYAEVNTLIVDGTPIGINSGFTNATVIDGGQIITGSITADKIYGGTLTLGGPNNANGVMNIKDASGVIKARGDVNGFFILDKGVNVSLESKNNLIPDHSFEAIPTSGSADATYYDFAIGKLSRNIFDWSASGSPRILSARNTDIAPEAAFGLQCVVVNSSNWLSVNVPVKPSTTYYLSGYTARGYRNPTAGTPKLYVDFRDGNLTYISAVSQTFTPNTSMFDWKRVGFSFTTPDASTNVEFASIVVYSADANYVYWDGIQLVEGAFPAIYDPEENLWRAMYGVAGLQGFKAFNTNYVRRGSATINDTTNTTISFGITFPGIPTVVASYHDTHSGDWGIVKTRNTSTTSFDAIIGGPTSGLSRVINWIAIYY